MIGKGWRLAFLFLLIFMFGFAVWEIRDFGYPAGEPDLDDDGFIKTDPATGEDLYLHDNNGTVPVYNEMTDEVEWKSRPFMDGQIIIESIDPNGTTNANNVVTAVVFDFRGFDTLGEATVLFAAVSGVLVTLRAAFPKKKGGGKE